MGDPAKTPLDALHVSLGARMVPFAGYAMPVQYPGRHPEGAPAHPGGRRPLRRQPHGPDRAARRRSGDWRTPAAALERLVPVDVLGLAEGRQRYALLHRRERRHPRRPDGRQPRRPPVPGGQRRAQGATTSPTCRRGSGGALQRRAARPGAGRAAGAEGRGGAGDAACRTWRRCASWTCCAARHRRHAGRWCRAPATPARTASRSRSSPAAPRPRRAAARHRRRRAGRARRPRLAPARGRALPLGPRHRRRRRRRSRRRSNGRSSRRGAAAAPAPAASRATRRSCARSPRARRAAGSACFPRAARRCARAPSSSPTRTARRSAAITSGGFGPSLDAPVAMGYVPIELAAPGTRLCGRLRGRLLPATVAKMPLRHARATSGVKRRRDECCDSPRSTSG